MKYKILVALWTASLVSIVAGTTLLADEKNSDVQSNASSEAPRKVLEMHVGEWDEVAEFPNGQKVNARGSTEWALGGKYILSKYTIALKGGNTLEHLTLMTWDAKRKVYRSWMFSSAGAPVESTAAWDAESQTLTSVSAANEAGTTTVSKSHFADDDTINWTVKSRDKNGKTVFSLKGTDTRRK